MSKAVALAVPNGLPLPEHRHAKQVNPAEASVAEEQLTDQPAAALRVQWMREMGLSQEEIDESMALEPPSMDYERCQLEAVRRLKTKSPSRREIEEWSRDGV
jgi:hypothetical protein